MKPASNWAITAVVAGIIAFASLSWPTSAWPEAEASGQSDPEEKTADPAVDAPVASQTLGAKQKQEPGADTTSSKTSAPLAKGNYVGGAPHQELSTDEAARQLANPNSPLASLTLRSRLTTWTGDLPGADGRSSGTFLFQPVFPFALNKEDSIFVRPAFPYLVNQPVVDTETGRTYSKSGFGDMGYDVAWGHNFASGLMTAFGVAGSIPIGAKELSNDTWTLGPEVLLAYFGKWGLVGLYPNHQWDVSGPAKVSTTTVQTFLMFLPGGGWAWGTQGISTYDNEADQWTVPLNLMVSKTVKMGKTPVKFAFQVNYYVEQADELGPDWMFEFDITPVVKNIFTK